MAERDVLKELSTIETLPTLPGIVARVLGEVDSEEADVGRVAELISQDPAMTGQILRVANSVMFSASGLSTTSIHGAVSRIGLREVRNLVVSLGVVDAFEATADFDFREFWRHSFSSAVASGTVAQHLPFPPPGVARDNPYFLAGLLHDVGTLLLCQALGAEYAELTQDAKARGLSLEKVEQEHLGADHQQVGAALIRRWGLPLEVAAAAEFHHTPEAAPEDGRDYVAVVTAADAVLGCHGRGSPAEGEPGLESAATLIGLDPDRLQDMANEVVAAAETSDALLAAAFDG